MPYLVASLRGVILLPSVVSKLLISGHAISHISTVQLRLCACATLSEARLLRNRRMYLRAAFFGGRTRSIHSDGALRFRALRQLLISRLAFLVQNIYPPPHPDRNSFLGKALRANQLNHLQRISILLYGQIRVASRREILLLQGEARESRPRQRRANENEPVKQARIFLYHTRPH